MGLLLQFDGSIFGLIFHWKKDFFWLAVPRILCFVL